jgi:hypothetical protein
MSLAHGVVVVTWRGKERGLGVGDGVERKREQPKSFARLASGVLLLQRHKTKQLL